ncbi:hypothetical protein Esi_0227_0043 [Ectocarpus siliculosus]|uniref:Myb-like domain-containing protein n=1 Tax=Ectocarpus siliculosus TaxID=2880 RepID=D7FS48_ECTSI|nr:hypothetical protein Esi_0227_0043 [Ectocarpus siliculosus]|eukprot:CBJ30989.1 hypothetical protein Esi_0227_0043 [Ectocarpus siliculosus]
MRSSGGGRGGGGPGAVAWTAAELEVLRQSIRENGLDDWRTLGDWSQAICMDVLQFYNEVVFQMETARSTTTNNRRLLADFQNVNLCCEGWLVNMKT